MFQRRFLNSLQTHRKYLETLHSLTATTFNQIFNNYPYKERRKNIQSITFLAVMLKSLTRTNLPESYFRKQAKELHINR